MWNKSQVRSKKWTDEDRDYVGGRKGQEGEIDPAHWLLALLTCEAQIW